MSNLVQVLAAGATVVTPNNRLARDVAARFDAAQRASGVRAWRAAKCLPWSLWLDERWRAALAAGIEDEPPALLTAPSAHALWHAIVAGHDRDWLNARGAARHAANAWRTFHAWRDRDEPLRTIATAGRNDDAACFAQWGERYQSRLAALGAIDHAQLPDVLTTLARSSRPATAERVVLHGFIAFTPQQRRLVDALRAVGGTIEESPASGAAAANLRRTRLATPRDELVHALGYVRAALEADAEARVAVVVADLDERRDEAVALAEEILCPEHLTMFAPDSPRPYGISLGESLASMPIVACALDLIALSAGPVEAMVAASTVRAPFLPDALAHWTARADLERRWLALGRRYVVWRDVARALRADPALGERFAALTPPSSVPRLPRDWAAVWSDWLRALGWPGATALTSAQWQAREAWSATLATFASTGMVAGALSPTAAFDSLRALARETLFQPEAPPAPIQILGVLEAAGLAFDRAWLAGFDAQRWPGTATPEPLLPLSWQRLRGVPRASAEGAFAQASARTSALSRLAPDIVVSHAATIDEAPLHISPLFADWEFVESEALPGAGRIADAIACAKIERWRDSRAPHVAPETRVRGGAHLIESQSTCPFQAFARYRLGARAFPDCADGVSAPERGQILHAMLKSFWDDVGDRATLARLDDAALQVRIDAAVRAGMAALPDSRWRAVASAVRHAEAQCLAATLRAWIDKGERGRPAFRVRAHEKVFASDIHGLRLDVRVDRIDELASGGLAVIDYKSGNVIGPTRWFAERPEGLQIAVYADAVERATGGPIRALAYAQVKAGRIDVAGIVDDPLAWPALASVDAVDASDWPHARAGLSARVARLAQDIRSGVADVAPRNAAACRRCDLQPLCRVQMLEDGADEVVDDEAEGGGAADDTADESNIADE